MANKKTRLKELFSTSVSAKQPSEKQEIFYTLDYDPIQAARSLIIQHVKTHARMIAMSFAFAYSTSDLQEIKYIKNWRIRRRPKPFIFDNPYNVWFYSTMYEELCKIYKAYSGDEMIEPDEFIREQMLYVYDASTHPEDNSGKLVQPNYLYSIARDRKFKQYRIVGFDNPSNTDIDIQRLMYVVDGYSLEQFPCGAPSWYSPMCREIYRKYDRLSKRTFIIETDSNGKYRYYYQYISDKPKEILNVNEMRELIDSFLYQV